MANFNNPLNFLVLLLSLTTLVAIASADLYDPPTTSTPPSSPPPPPQSPLYPAPPPPSGVAGKEFPPESSVCSDPLSKCYGVNIVCPEECPSMKPADPNAKACTIDCNKPKCEASCKKQKPNCEGKGSACGDPRFVGGDGIVFYFHGKSNQHFTLVSDRNLQINSRFIGRRPEGRTRDNTWIQALGLLFNNHSFTLSANKVALWDDKVDQLTFTYDDNPVVVSEDHLSSWTALDQSGLVVERRSRANSVVVTLPGVVEISASVVPITKEDDRIHNYQIPSDDCFAHLEVQFRFFDLSDRVEGVLGQTYRPDFLNPVKMGVAMPIMGGERKYATSSLTSTGCEYCIFSPRPKPEAILMDTGLSGEPAISTMDCTSKMSNGRGIVCRR